MKTLNDRKQFKHALDLFYKYEQNNDEIISDRAINQALKSSTNIKDFQGGLNIHRRYSSRIEKNDLILASLIHFYMQFGNVSHAQQLFDTTKKITPGIYGAMMKGFITNNMFHKAIEVFFEIPNPDEAHIVLVLNACARTGTQESLTLARKVLSNLPHCYRNNSNILNTALDAFIKCNDLSSAEQIFPKIKTSTISCGNLMNAYNKNKQPEKTLDLYKQMKIDGTKCDSIIFLLLINACSDIGISSIQQSISEEIPKSYLDNYYIQNALIDMWGKSGNVDKASSIFKSLIQPDTVAYASMINSYGLNGMGLQAIELFHQMPSEMISEATCVSVLNACSHSGLVDEARAIFSKINDKTEKMYTTMVDCLSRSFLFEEAEELVGIYESHHPPSASMLTALLSGARNKKDAHLAEKIFRRIQQHRFEDRSRLTSASILLANVYASVGEIEKSTDIKIRLRQLGLKKTSGLVWTETDGQVHTFRAHDYSHPRSKEIYDEAQRISQQLTEHGHKYDASWITRPLEQEETIESVLCGHSEKLAIAWNFVQNPNTTRIQITKNLRVCGDCHRATKLIALIRRCEIIVRDANRIHHFYTNGQCSCNDYF